MSGPNPLILDNIKKEPIEIKTEMPDYVENPELPIPHESMPKVSLNSLVIPKVLKSSHKFYH